MLIQSKPCVRLFHQVDQILEFESDDSDEFFASKPTRGVTTSTKPKKQNIRRSVQFNLAKNQIHELEPYATNEKQKRWYRSSELKGFRKSVAALGRKSTAVMPGTQSNAPRSNIFALMRDLFKECAQDSCLSTRRAALEHTYIDMISAKPELLGIERYVLEAAVKNHAKIRRERMFSIISRANRFTTRLHGRDGNAEYIRVSCEQITVASRTFALRMAQLHAACISFDEPAGCGTDHEGDDLQTLHR